MPLRSGFAGDVPQFASEMSEIKCFSVRDCFCFLSSRLLKTMRKSVTFCLADVASCPASKSACFRPCFFSDLPMWQDFGLRFAVVIGIAGLAMMPPLKIQLIPFISCCLLSLFTVGSMRSV